MTDAEKAQLFVEFLSAANVVFASYMTLVFAMLTASWFLAAHMSRMILVLLPWVGSIIFFFAVRRQRASPSIPE